MALMAGVDLPHGAIRESIATAVHVVVHVDRQADGRRVVAGDRGRRAGRRRLARRGRRRGRRPRRRRVGSEVPERSLVGVGVDRRFGARRRRECAARRAAARGRARAIARSYAAGLPFGDGLPPSGRQPRRAGRRRSCGRRASKPSAGRVPADTLFALADAPGGGLDPRRDRRQRRARRRSRPRARSARRRPRRPRAAARRDRGRDGAGALRLARRARRAAARARPARARSARRPSCRSLTTIAGPGRWSSSARSSTSPRSCCCGGSPAGWSDERAPAHARRAARCAPPRCRVSSGSPGATVRRRPGTGLPRELPDALELLAAAIDGGAPVDRALAAVAAHVGPPLVDRAAPGGRRPARRAARGRAGPRAGTAGAGRAGVVVGGARRAAGQRAARSGSHERERRRREVRLRAAAAGPRMTLVVAGLLAPAALLLVVGAELLSVVQTVRGSRERVAGPGGDRGGAGGGGARGRRRRRCSARCGHGPASGGGRGAPARWRRRRWASALPLDARCRSAATAAGIGGDRGAAAAPRHPRDGARTPGRGSRRSPTATPRRGAPTSCPTCCGWPGSRSPAGLSGGWRLAAAAGVRDWFASRGRYISRAAGAAAAGRRRLLPAQPRRDRRRRARREPAHDRGQRVRRGAAAALPGWRSIADIDGFGRP